MTRILHISNILIIVGATMIVAGTAQVITGRFVTMADEREGSTVQAETEAPEALQAK